MVPTQLELTEDQVNALRLLSVQRGASLSELVRESVDLLLREEAWAALVQRALNASGKFRSGRHDIGENHDEYLAEAYEG